MNSEFRSCSSVSICDWSPV